MRTEAAEHAEPGPRGRRGRDVGHIACVGCNCSGDEFRVEAAGPAVRTLFPWEMGRGGPNGKNGPVFGPERAHLEVPARTVCCGTTFVSLAPDLVADAIETHGQPKERAR